jgi:monovalent cation/proton antiporter MnhG/PhaG subunit
MAFLSAFFLIGGAAICLIAAVGVLRLPDFFMRAHAATEAGVAGCGLVLIGVGFAYPSVEMWIKILIAISFLLMTTPIAGHLLSRAGYVAGVPMWGGTSHDELEGELGRGAFEMPEQKIPSLGTAISNTRALKRVVVAINGGESGRAAIDQAILLAKQHSVPLVGLAIVDIKMLSNVGPVPLGGNYYASQLRASQIEKARHSLGQAVRYFEQTAAQASIVTSILMDEGDPVKIIVGQRHPNDLLIVTRCGWFDHGVSGEKTDTAAYLVRQEIWPLVSVTVTPSDIMQIAFVHDASAHSDDTLRWLLRSDPWPTADLLVVPDAATRVEEIRHVVAMLELEERAGRIVEPDEILETILSHSQVVVFGNEGHEGWINRMRRASRPKTDHVPIVVFG